MDKHLLPAKRRKPGEQSNDLAEIVLTEMDDYTIEGRDRNVNYSM